MVHVKVLIFSIKKGRTRLFFFSNLRDGLADRALDLVVLRVESGQPEESDDPEDPEDDEDLDEVEDAETLVGDAGALGEGALLDRDLDDQRVGERDGEGHEHDDEVDGVEPVLAREEG